LGPRWTAISSGREANDQAALLLELDLAPELFEAADAAADDPLFALLVEVVRAEILVGNLLDQHVPNMGKSDPSIEDATAMIALPGPRLVLRRWYRARA
jgi:hypothetical protein